MVAKYPGVILTLSGAKGKNPLNLEEILLRLRRIRMTPKLN
jgi:hypothetical protein